MELNRTADYEAHVKAMRMTLAKISGNRTRCNTCGVWLSRHTAWIDLTYYDHVLLCPACAKNETNKV